MKGLLETQSFARSSSTLCVPLTSPNCAAVLCNTKHLLKKKINQRLVFGNIKCLSSMVCLAIHKEPKYPERV